MRARSGPAKSSLTIRDIARLAGVSAATVSRVVNADARVSTAKRGAVMAVIEQVHYQPSVVAQWLARGTSQAVGVLTADLASDFYGQALKGIEAGLRNSGYHPIFASGAQPAEADAAIAQLLRNRIAAMIAVGFFREETLRELARKLPFVNVGPRIAGLEDRCAVADNLNGAFEAAGPHDRPAARNRDGSGRRRGVAPPAAGRRVTSAQVRHPAHRARIDGAAAVSPAGAPLEVMRPETTLLLGSSNPGKLREMRQLLAGLPYRVLGPADVGLRGAPEETGTTFTENAILKAR